MVGAYSHILKSEGWGAPSTFFSEEGYPECKLSLKALQRTTGKAQSFVSPLGDQALLSVAKSARECAWWGRLRWGGRALARERRETPRSDYVEGICYVSFPPSPLSLCFFSVFLSLSPFPRPLLLHLSGRILECSFDRLNLSLALESWLAEGLGGGGDFN